MVGKRMNMMVATLVVAGTLGMPAIGSAQGYRDRGYRDGGYRDGGYRYGDDDRQSVVVRCGPGQRAVMTQRQTYRGTRLVARCVGSRHYINDRYGRRDYVRSDRYYDNGWRPASRRGYYYERGHRRSKTKSALMIAGSAATGAGIGGSIRGKKGALVGAAIGGGVASIYEASKRR